MPRSELSWKKKNPGKVRARTIWHRFTLLIRSTALCQLSQIPIYKNRWIIGEFQVKAIQSVQEITEDVHMREVKRTREMRQVRFRWRVREHVQWQCQSTRARPLIFRIRGPWLLCPNESGLVRKRPHKSRARQIFEDFFFLLWIFLLFFDCSACFLLAKTESSLDTLRTSCLNSDRNTHTEVQHLPSTILLDRFLRTRSRQLPKWRATALHGHSILHPSWWASKRKKNGVKAQSARKKKFFWHHTRLQLVMSGFTSFLLVTCFTSDIDVSLTRTRLVSCVFLTPYGHSKEHRSDCEHVSVIRTSRVRSPDRTWPDHWLSEMSEEDLRQLKWKIICSLNGGIRSENVWCTWTGTRIIHKINNTWMEHQSRKRSKKYMTLRLKYQKKETIEDKSNLSRAFLSHYNDKVSCTKL